MFLNMLGKKEKIQGKTNSHPRMGDESGFSILQVLVGVALLGTVTALFSSGLLNNVRARKQIESSGNFSSIEQAFANELATILNSMSPTDCLTTSMIANRPFGADLGGGALRYVTQLGSKVDPAQAAGVGDAMTPGSETGKAKDRCKNPVFIPKASATDANKNRIYFCMEFDKTSSAADGSIASADHAFAEVAFYMKNSTNNQKASCNAFITDRRVGAQAFYTLYWSTTTDGKKIYKKKHGTMFAKSPAPP